MTTHSPYCMRDQVDNLVPSLMNLNGQGTRRQRGRMLELAVFVVTMLGYLIALGLTN